MQKTVVKVFGVLISLLAVVGLLMDGHWMGIFNVDPALDWLRVGLALFLLYVGFVSDKDNLVRLALWVTGGLYVGMGILGMIDPKLWGMLPNGLTWFDVAFHLVTGLLAIAVVSKKDAARGPLKV